MEYTRLGLTSVGASKQILSPTQNKTVKSATYSNRSGDDSSSDEDRDQKKSKDSAPKNVTNNPNCVTISNNRPSSSTCGNKSPVTNSKDRHK